MKKEVLFKFAIIISSLIPFFGNAQEHQLSSHQSTNRNVVVASGVPLIKSVAEKIFPSGSILLKQNINVTENELLQNLKVEKLVTFSLQRETESRFDKSIIFRRYQQFYKGVEIDGGGYTVKLHRNSAKGHSGLQLFSPNIYYNISVNTSPTVLLESIPKILNVAAISMPELIISDRYGGHYKLLWKFFIPGNHVEQVWLDAHTGKIVHRFNSATDLFSTLPTYVWGQLVDFKQGNTTFLRSVSGDLKIHEGLHNPSDPVNPSQWNDSQIPETTNTFEWLDVDAAPGSRQSFFVATQVIPQFLNMGVDFENVHIANTGQARALMGSTTQNAYIQIGSYSGIPASLYDIIAHELGHCYLYQFLHITDENTNASLHEGISDIIGTYIESFIQGVDWIMGDDEPDLVPLANRNLSIQVCESNLTNAGKHQRGRVIGHWFFSISNGIPADNIPAIGMQAAIDILVEALNNLNNPNAGFSEMRTQTLLAAELNFGICSPEYQAVRNAWDRVCVTGQTETCPCDAYSSPTLSATSIPVNCPISADLNALHTGSVPNGSVLIWSSDNDPTDGVSPIISSPTTLTGTYFAYYYNAEFDCFSPVSSAVTVDGAQSQDVHITSNTPYSTPMEVFGDIYIENGATLTITSTLTLDSDVDIYVENDSRLILDGGTLTACGQSWQGVKVAGQFDLGSYSPVESSDLKRGYVELKNGAIIEKAIVGIDGRDEFVFGTDKSLYHGGGKITISSGSIIRDCGIGVRLHSYGWGSVIGAGPSGPGYPIGYEDEPSTFSDSYFRNCDFAAIYSDQNIGLTLFNNVFDGNYSDYEGYLSSIRATENDFSSFVYIASEHPVIPGSTFTNNTFTNSVFGIDGQGNIKRHNLNINIASNSFFSLGGELWYALRGNEISNSGNFSLFIESTGEDLDNKVLGNDFSSQFVNISVFGENDTEFLANCFFDATQAGLEINSGSSIHETQGSQDQSAGNCFQGSRIKTGSGISHFNYWTRDGYHSQCHPTNNCKYPGACNGFTLNQSEEETEVNCELMPILGDPPSKLNCECDPGLTGCTDAISSIRETIAGLGSSSGDELLMAQYRRCLDSLIRTYIDTTLAVGNIENCIDFLSVQPEFRYRIMAYGIMTHNLEYERAWDFIDTLITSNTVEDNFVNVQKIWLDYLKDMNSFTLSPTDSMKLRTTGEAFNPLAGYARTVFYKLTGERIVRDFIHTDSTVTPRSSNEILPSDDSRKMVEFHVWPNPVIDHSVDIYLENADPDLEYKVVCYDAFGALRSTSSVSNENINFPISDTPGIYIVCLWQDGQLIHTKKIIRH